MNWIQRLVFHAGDKQAGSTYGSPIFTGVNMPNLTNCDYVKVRVLEAQIGCEIASGGDESHIELSIVGKRPLNQSVATGQGTKRTGGELAHIPFQLKEQSQAGFYFTTNRDQEHDYLVFPVQEFQDTTIQFLMTDGGDVGEIEEPSASSFADYVIVLGIEPIPRQQ